MPAEFRLVDTKWDRELSAAVSANHTHLRVICPFIQKRTAERLLAAGCPDKIQVITRFSTRDFCEGGERFGRVDQPAAAAPHGIIWAAEWEALGWPGVNLQAGAAVGGTHARGFCVVSGRKGSW